MYKDYSDLSADRLARFGGFRSYVDLAGAFYLLVNFSSTTPSAVIGGRLIMFGN